MKYSVKFQKQRFEVEVEGDAPDYAVSIDGRRVPVNASNLGDPSLLSMLLDNRSFLAHVVRSDARRGLFDVSIAGKFVRLEVLDELASMAEQMQAQQSLGRFVLEAPMPGLVVEVRVRTGDKVEIGTPLVVMEAMKMQNELASEMAGTVREVRAQVGQAVESGAALMVIEAD